MTEELINLPDDLTTITNDDELTAYETMVVAEFARVNDEEVTPGSLHYMMRLATDLERLRVEIKRREIAAKDAEQRRLAMAETPTENEHGWQLKGDLSAPGLAAHIKALEARVAALEAIISAQRPTQRKE